MRERIPEFRQAPFLTRGTAVRECRFLLTLATKRVLESTGSRKCGTANPKHFTTRWITARTGTFTDKAIPLPRWPIVAEPLRARLPDYGVRHLDSAAGRRQF